MSCALKPSCRGVSLVSRRERATRLTNFAWRKALVAAEAMTSWSCFNRRYSSASATGAMAASAAHAASGDAHVRHGTPHGGLAARQGRRQPSRQARHGGDAARCVGGNARPCRCRGAAHGGAAAHAAHDPRHGANSSAATATHQGHDQAQQLTDNSPPLCRGHVGRDVADQQAGRGSCHHRQGATHPHRELGRRLERFFLLGGALVAQPARQAGDAGRGLRGGMGDRASGSARRRGRRGRPRSRRGGRRRRRGGRRGGHGAGTHRSPRPAMA